MQINARGNYSREKEAAICVHRQFDRLKNASEMSDRMPNWKKRKMKGRAERLLKERRHIAPSVPTCEVAEHSPVSIEVKLETRPGVGPSPGSIEYEIAAREGTGPSPVSVEIEIESSEGLRLRARGRSCCDFCASRD